MITQTFQGVTPERWQDIKQVVHSDMHFDIDSNDGSKDEYGAVLSWLLAGTTLTITVEVGHFGWILSHAGFHCEQDIMDALAKKIDGA